MVRLHDGGWDGIGQDGGVSMALTASNFMFSLIKLHLKKKKRGHSDSCGKRLKTNILWPGMASYRYFMYYYTSMYYHTLCEGSFPCDSDRPLSCPFHPWEKTTGFELGAFISNEPILKRSLALTTTMPATP